MESMLKKELSIQTVYGVGPWPGSRCSFSMMVKWSNDGLLQDNDGEILVNDSEMSVWSYHFTIINEHFTIISLK